LTPSRERLGVSGDFRSIDVQKAPEKPGTKGKIQEVSLKVELKENDFRTKRKKTSFDDLGIARENRPWHSNLKTGGGQ